jgi:hypothetical protein
MHVPQLLKLFLLAPQIEIVETTLPEPARIEDPLFSSILPGGADFIGELGNAHFSFRQHDVDVNDDCHVRLDNQVVLRFYLHGIL